VLLALLLWRNQMVSINGTDQIYKLYSSVTLRHGMVAL